MISRLKRLGAVAACLALATTSCGFFGGEDSSDDTVPTPVPGNVGSGGDQLVSLDPNAPSITLRSAAPPSRGEAVELREVEGTELTEQEVEAARTALPPWEPGDTTSELNRPAESLRPPATGVVDGPAFGEPDIPTPDVDSGPLEVTRVQPEGAVDLAPFVTISFNQDMVPLATLTQIESIDVPVTIEPEVDGRWEWLGTRVLRFQPDPEVLDRMPMATDFTVTVPAGTTSATGTELNEGVSFRFSTPVVQVLGVSPDHDHVTPTQVFRVEFSSPVDPDAIVAVTTIEAEGRSYPTRIATDAEKADSGLVGAGQPTPDNVVYLRAVDGLPLDTVLTVQVGPNTPSPEGPKTNPNPARFGARTYAPLKLERIECGECEPGSTLQLQFNNPLDPDEVADEMFSISPAIEAQGIDVNGRWVSVHGFLQPDTTYEITAKAGLTDIYGQSLASDQSRSVRIKNPSPQLFWMDRLITTDPFAETPTLQVFTTNYDQFRFRAWRVTPELFPQYERWIDNRWRDEERDTPPPGDPVMDETISTEGARRSGQSTAVDLSDALDGEFGHLIVVVEPVGELASLSRNNRLWWQNQPVFAWVQVTDIGLDTVSDGQRLHAWATDLRTGEPLEGVEIGQLTTSAVEPTDANGQAQLAQFAGIVVATNGDDTALLNEAGFRRNNRTDRDRWFVIDDRGVYRPGETVSIKGWLRSADADLQPTIPGTRDIRWRVRDPFGVEIATGDVDVSDQAGFDFTFDLPPGTNIGVGQVEFNVAGSDTYWHSFEVQEFRRPEFEVSTDLQTAEPVVAGEQLEILAEARYFAGGPLPDAPIRWEVRSRNARYTPPGWGEFSFSRSSNDWWYVDDFEADAAIDDFWSGPWPGGGEEEFAQLTDVLNADGRHLLNVSLGGIGTSPVTLASEATVTDVNGQSWPSQNELLVHPGERYVGLRSVASFGKRNEEAPIEVIVASIDGEAVPGAEVTVRMGRIDWQRVDGDWSEVMVDVEECQITSSETPEVCRFTPTVGGRYRAEAAVSDSASRTHESAVTYWVSGGSSARAAGVELEQVQVIPAEQTFQPGDTAEVLIAAPFPTAFGQVITSRDGIRSVDPIEITDGSTTISIPLIGIDVPNVDVQVELVGSAPRTDRLGEPIEGAPERPAFATGRTRLNVSPEGRRLQVEATPAAPDVTPGASTSIDLRITDAEGRPLQNAEAAVIVVDEAVLAVSQYEVPDPIQIFYPTVSGWLQTRRGRSLIRLDELRAGNTDGGTDASDDAMEDDDAMAEDAMEESAVPTAAGLSDEGADLASSRSAYGAKSGQPIAVRKNFAALAAFEPNVVTDADGRATITVDLPDSLTRYRVVVVSAFGDRQFGTGESAITASLPVTVRPAVPRFANFGDSFRFGAVLQNTTDVEVTADLVVDTANLSIEGTGGRRVTIPANNRILVPFEASAAEAGEAIYRVAVVSPGGSDAATASFPVYTPATSEAFATYGEIDAGAIRLPIQQPTDVYPQFGGLQVQTSSTILQSLTDSVLYLQRYRYDSADQYSGRILGLIALADVLAEFDVPGLQNRAQIDATINADITALQQLQLPGEGVFLGYPTARQASPYQTVLAAHALVEADRAGYNVNPQTLALAVDVMNWIEQYQFGDWSPRVTLGLEAYATHVLERAGQPNVAKAESVMDRLQAESGTQVDSLALIWPTLAGDASRSAEIERRIRNAAVDTAGSVTFANAYTQDDYYVYPSSVKSDAIIINALLDQDPDSDLIAKAVRAINAARTREGRWSNVQENAFVLIGLRSYFDTFESVDPDFKARAWIGDTYAAESEFDGRSTDVFSTEVPMSTVIDATADDASIVVQKDGDGRLYYRLGLEYAPTDLDVPPLDRGFVVSRTYRAVEGTGSVTQQLDGTWQVEPGTTVQVEVTMVADSQRTHVALIDPLAAGLEPRNPVFRAPLNGGQGRWWWWNWYEHSNLRDDRAEAFTTYLGAGTYSFTYLVEATTPGTYVVPPARAEEVYAPETFGRSAADKLIVR